MWVRRFEECQPFKAGDSSLLREYLHPQKESLPVRYSFAHAEIPPGKVTLPHRLRSSEVYYILEGEAMMHVDEDEQQVSAGCLVFIPPHARQFIKNTGPQTLKFLCLVDPAWQKTDEEIL